MAKILLLHTGGTLGMVGGDRTALRPGAFARTLRERIPELSALAKVTLELFSNLDSCEMQPELWSRMAGHLHRRLPEFDGAVVTHGTDTLAYTACALSYMLGGLRKPVVLTGSQRPLREVRSDARLNLIDAVISALWGPPEVTVCFDSHLYRGNRTRKLKVAEYDAFDSPNHPVLGVLGVKARFETGIKPKGRFTLRDRLDPNVFILKLFPGLDPRHVLPLLPQLHGLVIEAYGAGTFPLDEKLGRSLRPVLAEARRRHLPVVVTTQAAHNGVELGLYESGQLALDEGAISGGDMTSSAAVVKLMHALAYGGGLPAIRRYIQTPLAGELTPR